MTGSPHSIVLPPVTVAPEAFARLIALVVVALAGAVLLGWWLDVAVLRQLMPGNSTMKANTAAGLLTAGLALRLFAAPVSGGRASVPAAIGGVVLALVPLLVGLLTLVEYIAGLDLGIDQVLAADRHSAATAAPGRMTPMSAVGLLLAGGALLLFVAPSRVAAGVAQALAALVAAMFLVLLLGHLYEVRSLLSLWPHATVAVHTAAGFMLLASGLLLARARQGWVATFFEDLPSAGLGRRLLLTLLLLVPALGWLTLGGVRAGYYGIESGHALLVLLTVCLGAAVLWRFTRDANDTARVLEGWQSLHAMLSRTNQALLRSSTREAIFDAVCRAAVEAGRLPGAWVGERNGADRRLRAVARAWEKAPTPDAPAGAPHADDPLVGWPGVDGLAEDRTTVVEDVLASTATAGAHAAARDAGIGTAALVPVRPEGRTVAWICFYGRRPHGFSSRHLATFEDIAADAAFGLETIERTQVRRRLEALLVQKDARYDALVRTIPVGVYVLEARPDGEPRLSYASPRYSEILGLDPATVPGGEELSPDLVHADDRAGFERARATARRLRRPFHWEGRVRVHGQTRWISVESRPGDPDAQPGGWSGVLMDVTGRKSAESERNLLHTQLVQAQKMEVIGQLTGGIAHDFNNILASVLGYATLARERYAGEPGGKLDEYLRAVIVAGERARDLVAKMLAFSRTHARTGAPAPRALAPIVEDVVSLLAGSLPTTLDIRASAAPDLPPVRIDSVDVHQVLMNLAVNARDAIGDHGCVRFDVALRAVRATRCASCGAGVEGLFVELAVRDDGHGIPAGVAAQIFEPFYTTKAVGKGTGLGLPMVHGIVHRAGGHILLETAPEAGTTFRLLLPPAEVIDAGGAPGRLADTDAVRFAGARIMVVDDEPALATLVREILESREALVDTFTDPVAALFAFRADPEAWTAVVLDQTMPGMTGAEMAGGLLALRPALPIVLCTGYSDRIDAERAAALGIRTFLAKPVQPAVLLQALAAALAAGTPR